MEWKIDNLAFVQAIKSIFDNDSGKIVSNEGQRIINEDGEELRKILEPKSLVCSICKEKFESKNDLDCCSKCAYSIGA